MSFEQPSEDHSKEAELTPEQQEIRELKAKIHQLEEENKELKQLAYVDRLTGALNRHGLDEIAGTLIAQRERKDGNETAKPMAVMIIDIDNFKKLNDTKGHDEGDRVLREAARHLKDSVRRGDVVARWGGEEFVIVFDKADAQDIFNKYFDKEKGGSRINFPEASFSGGITTLQPGEDITTAVARADQALYAAKKTGKDRLLLTEHPEQDLPSPGNETKE